MYALSKRMLIFLCVCMAAFLILSLVTIIKIFAGFNGALAQNTLMIQKCLPS